jgi:hypothetical protein
VALCAATGVGATASSAAATIRKRSVDVMHKNTQKRVVSRTSVRATAGCHPECSEGPAVPT